MRTTVTLDDDAAAIVATRMRTRHVGFKQAVNELIKAGAGDTVSTPFETPAFDLGQPRVDLTKATRLAGDLEDEHLIERQRRGA